MPITRSGKYIGYTIGGAHPTLYFEEGRYTQVHTNPENVGWHPVIGDQYQVNISSADYASIRVRSTDDASVVAAKKAAKKALVEDVLDGSVADSADPAGRLFEVSEINGTVTSTHTSRARLIRVGDAGFNPAFDEHYAQQVLDNGSVAKNSTDSLLKPIRKIMMQIEEAVTDGRITPSEDFQETVQAIDQAYQDAYDAIRYGDFFTAGKILAKASQQAQDSLEAEESTLRGLESRALDASIKALDQVSKNSHAISEENFEDGYEADDEGGYDSDDDESEGGFEEEL